VTTAIIPVHNRADLLERLLGSMASQSVPFAEIIVVDNFSSDGAADLARARGCRVIAMDGNAGFARAVNVGWKSVTTPLAAILNSDVELDPRWLERLETAIGDHAYATGLILDAANHNAIDGTYDLLSRGACAWRAGHGEPATTEMKRTGDKIAGVTCGAEGTTEGRQGAEDLPTGDRLGEADATAGDWQEGVDTATGRRRIGARAVTERRDGAADAMTEDRRGAADLATGDRQREIAIAPGTACIFRRDVLEQLGGFDESYGSYLEDVDLGLRCLRGGHAGIYVPEAIAYHHGSATLGRWNPRVVRLISRNQLLLVARHYDRALFRSCFWHILAGQMLWGAVAWRHGAALSWLAGKWDALKNFHLEGTPSVALQNFLMASEREINLRARDAYWRWYFRLTRAAH
jgi:GT2 family glycosyltransferase